MQLHEYQGKRLLKSAGIGIPEGFIARHSNVIFDRAKCMIPRLAVKAQVHSGGRGKLGAVRLVYSASEAVAAASAMIGSSFDVRSGDGRSLPVRSVLVEEIADAASEKYIAFVLDRKSGLPRLLASSVAGAEVESAGPASIPLPAGGGSLDQGLVLSVLAAMEMPDALKDEAGRLIRRLADFFFTNECLMLEINPLAVTAEGRLVALDAKIELDDHSLFRHPELAPLRDHEQEGAIALGSSCMAVVLLGGDIGILANGAGLGLAVMDGLGARGGAAANFLDIGGAASAGDVRLAVEWMLRNERIRSILVHIFGGIVRCDLVAEGLLLALRSAPGRKPVAVRFAGTNGAEGLDLLRRSGMDFIFASSLGEALDAAVGSAASGKP